MPSRASVRDLLTDLLGRPVRVEAASPLVLSRARAAYLSAFRRDDGGVGGALVANREAAISTAAALGMVPEARLAQEIGEDGALRGELLDFFHEVANVLSKLLNSASSPRVVLRELLPVPGMVPADVAAFVRAPGSRADYRIEVEGASPGMFTLLSG